MAEDRFRESLDLDQSGVCQPSSYNIQLVLAALKQQQIGVGFSDIFEKCCRVLAGMRIGGLSVADPRSPLREYPHFCFSGRHAILIPVADESRNQPV